MNGNTGDVAYQTFRETRYFGSLNGIRCICIFLVLWHHSPLYTDLIEPPQILRRGFSGVDFFFVLSGFLITSLLIREEQAQGRFSLKGFYRRRILRIVPVYFLVVTLVAIWWIGVRGQDQWWGLLPYYYLFLANFLNSDIPLLAPMWSLSVEEQYYLIWPLVLLLLPMKNMLRMAVALIFISVAFCVGMGVLPELIIFPATELATFRLPMAGYSALLLGAVGALILHTPLGFRWAWGYLNHTLTPAILFTALLLAWQFLPPVLLGWPNLVMHSLMLLIIVAVSIREDNGLAGPLSWRPVARIGEVSYGIYLWHLIGLHFATEFTEATNTSVLGSGLSNFVIYVGLSIAIAELSYRFFESYFLKMK